MPIVIAAHLKTYTLEQHRTALR